MNEPRISTSAWWHPDTWAQAKVAYEHDRRRRTRPPTSFIEWIHHAIEQHAALGANGRARSRIPDRPESSERDGLRRVHPLRMQTRELLDQARVEDQQIGRHLSQSAWIYEAVTVAVMQSQRRARRVK